MSLHWLAWSSPVAWWWGLLTAVSGANVVLWFLLQRKFRQRSAGGSALFGIELMLLLCAAYVFGCAFRSVLPRADVQRICLFDTFLSSVLVGRSVATVAELCFAAQWAIILRQLGRLARADTTVNAASVIVPLICMAECCSWYAVLTTSYLGNAVENSVWAVAFLVVGIGLCRLLPEFRGLLRAGLLIAITGIAFYLVFLLTIDVPMYVGRWHAELASGTALLGPLQGLYDVSNRWVVTHELAEWKDEIPWMSLYFSAAVWASLLLCLLHLNRDDLARYRTESLRASRFSRLPGSIRSVRMCEGLPLLFVRPADRGVRSTVRAALRWKRPCAPVD